MSSIYRGDGQSIRADHVTVYGNGCNVNGDYNIVYGDGCRINGDYNTVHGNDCRINGDYNTVHGNECKIKGDNNVIHGDDCNVMGDHNTGPGSTSHTHYPNNVRTAPIRSITNSGIINRGIAIAGMSASVITYHSSDGRHTVTQVSGTPSIGQVRNIYQSYDGSRMMTQVSGAPQIEHVDRDPQIEQMHPDLPEYIKRLSEADLKSDSVATSSDTECVICLNNKAIVLISPCKHLCLCVECSRQLTMDDAGNAHRKQSIKCPKCRTGIDAFDRIFIN
jgi:C3HC4-type zinc finger (RING finger) protein